MGTNLVCAWDKARFFSLFYTVEAQFVPETSPVSGTNQGRRVAEEVYVLRAPPHPAGVSGVKNSHFPSLRKWEFFFDPETLLPRFWGLGP